MIFQVSQIADPVVERIVEEVNSYVTNKLHELYRVESEIENLSSRLTAIHAALQDAERVLADSDSKRLVDWLTKLRKVALDVEDVLATYATEAALRRELKQKFSAPLAWLRFRLKAANEIKEAVRRIDLISEEKEKFHFGGHYVNPNSRPQTTRVGLREISCLRDPSDIIGRGREKEEIVNWLLLDESNLQGDVPVLAIIGMGGLGKTTLAQVVFNDERIYKKKDEKCHFKAAIWVNVSADFSVDRILKEMLEFLTGMKQDMRPRSMIEDHILQVLGGRYFLLVLDDVWLEKLEWDSLHCFLKLCPQGSKVLITSRNEDVAKKMGAFRTQKLGLMSEEECWLLFAQRAFIADNCPGELEEIGRQIVHKCKFLPLAVKAMAGLLRGNTDVHRWQKILKNGIWESEQSPFGNETSNILPALKLSYDDLPSQLKQCFACCSLFPKGYMFDKNELVKLWIAEGYIQTIAADKIEEVGSHYFDELLTRSFFQLLDVNIDRNELFEQWIAEGYILPSATDHFDELLRGGHLGEYKERYKMHDLIHDLAKFVSSCCQQVVENEALSIEPESRHISFIGKDAQKLANEILKAQKLRTLLLPTTCTKDFGQTLDKMFRTLSYLRVLDLSSSSIKNLPESIGKLRLLGYLDLSRTEIRILPNAICNLHNLQILKLLRCLWLWELPKDLGNLKNLRYLELDDMFWCKCLALPPRIGGLTNLHNLHSFHVRQESGYRIEELKFMKNLEGVLHISNLENSGDAKPAELKQKECISKLVLEWSDKDADPRERTVQERVLEDLEPPHGLQELYINHFKGNRFSSWLANGMLHNLDKISLNGCIHCRILSIGLFPHLRELCIKGMLELVEWPEMIYPSLTRLSISNCPQLRELPCIFPNLRVAKIKQCDALTALPLMPSLMFLRLINNALLEDCNEAQIATGTDGDDNVIAILGSYMELLELKISNCPRLQALPQAFSPQKLEISMCTSLRTLPIPEHSQRLHHLELDKCIGPSLIEEIPSTSSLKSLIISNVRYIFSFPQLPHLPGLTALYIDNCQDLLTLSYADGFLQSLPSLKFLSISGCRKLVTFPDKDLPTSIEWLTIKDCSKLRSLHPRNCLVRLTSLKDLYLEDCPKLRFLPEDGLPTLLQHLRIQGCPLLAQRCSEGKAGQYWPMIRHIADLEIDFINAPEPSGCIRPEKRHFCCFGA